jgi:hypothetical protein
MVRVEKVFKEKEYRKTVEPPQTSTPPAETPIPPLNFEGLSEDVGSVLVAMRQFPFKSALTIIGALTVLYIGFKVTRKFGSIKANLKKI